MATFVSKPFKESKKQVESLGFDEKSNSKFLMKEWLKMRETAAEERRLLAKREAEKKRTEAEETA